MKGKMMKEVEEWFEEVGIAVVAHACTTFCLFVFVKSFRVFSENPNLWKDREAAGGALWCRDKLKIKSKSKSNKANSQGKGQLFVGKKGENVEYE